MTEPAAPLPPGSRIGILGGGQLGRMLAIAAARLGMRVHIFAPEEHAPAAEVAAERTRAAYDDAEALAAFARAVDVVTYEFENVPAAALRAIAPHAPVRPGARALEVSQDRLEEKRFLNQIGLRTVPFAAVSSAAELHEALARIGAPAILKTRRFGYDGKGQVRISDPADAEAALAALEGAPAILEAVAPFRRELSVIGARGLDGAVACFDPGENEHRDGILRRTRVPGDIPPAARAEAVLATGRLLNALDYVGVIGVELFETDQGLVVNEFAPRVHNTGHWTIEACVIDQFQQHIRAICGWPIGDGARHSDAEMRNLIGAEADEWREIAADPRAGLHLYGKGAARPGRKMGHVTRLGPRARP
ncbi:5-(carboxyamino)imidazole ribonucleotide synthase [Oceanicella actignis]|uniref:N5-carboxyaminoimidazole ribonucleotide synthase n=1 Tax=Oceanicella actignis TaxID=1189325 RepID=A0A1M7SRU6_9RHOB|nr:5-(carboxyamino)imidazole ribonucleotide synthase [Oceanicella actignis]SES68311.1 5-(carboxyamino)imidazole ribonucleotide synthase [Oceanicella actignis]SHN61245.1 5-(carboxyamino)imidazole ribonucleotide synthase [Oceanicella actignis]